MSSIRVKKGRKLGDKVGPSSAGVGVGVGAASSMATSYSRFAFKGDCGGGSSKCGDGRRLREASGFCGRSPLVLRREDLEGDDEWEGGILGRDILREKLSTT